MSAELRPVRATTPISWGPIAGAVLALLALLAAMAGGGGSAADRLGTLSRGPIAMLLMAAAITFGVVVLRRMATMVRAGDGPLLVLALIAALLVLAFWAVQVHAHLEYAALPVMASLSGFLLIGLTAIRVTSRLTSDSTPWESLTAQGTGGSRAEALLKLLGPGIVGLWFVATAAFLTGELVPFNYLRELRDSNIGAVGLLGGPVLVLIVTAGVLGGAYLLAVRQRQPSSPPRGRDLAMAAHLHDSVLQELAVIRRQADDPDAVRSIARSAERDLRDWLSGDAATDGATLTQAIKDVARQVEDETLGAEVDVIGVRNARLDDPMRALVEATREAIRNAVRHGGAKASVFTEVDDDGGITVFVRDSGPGFDQATIPNERRGVRDAIIGRMEAVSGSAAIETSADGTEVTLRLPAPKDGT